MEQSRGNTLKQFLMPSFIWGLGIRVRFGFEDLGFSGSRQIYYETLNNTLKP